MGQKEIILEAGDSLYFDARYDHGIQSASDAPAKFLAIVLE
ncbi:MAG: cupin domain-containing protein [Christensenellales bacterium]